MSEAQVTGPIQVFVIGFDDFQATGRIVAELRQVRKRGLIRVVDLLFVQKDAQGNVFNSMHGTDLSEEERQRLGAIAGGLLGLGAGGLEGAYEGAQLGALSAAERDFGLSADRLHELADAIPAGGAAAILVVEHHWAARLRNAITDAGGFTVAQAIISPRALVMVGRELNAIMEAEAAIEVAEMVKMAAAIEIAQTLAMVELIEEVAIAEAAEVVAIALAVEDAAVEDAVAALIAAELIEEAAAIEAAEVVAEAMEIEDEAIEEALEVVAASEEIKQAAARQAVNALVAAKIIEEEAVEAAIAAVLAANDANS